MWCPDDIGRDSWDWVGPPAWVRACYNSPEWGAGSSPVKNGASPDCIIVVVIVFGASVCPSSGLDFVRSLSATLSWYSFTRLCAAFAFTVPLNSSSIRLRQFPLSACLSVPWATTCTWDISLWIRTPPSLHVLCTHSSAPKHVPSFPSPWSPCPSSRLLIQDALHPGIVFVLAPRNRHDHLQIASVPSLPRCPPPDCSCEPNAISILHDDHSRGRVDAQIHAPSSHTHVNYPGGLLALPQGSFHDWQALHRCRCSFQSLIRRFAVATEFEPCQ